MIKIIANLYLKPECVNDAMPILKELVQKSRAEDGNVFYDLHVNKKDNTHLIFLEGWRDSEAIKTHNASEHFTTLLPQCAPMMAKDSELTLALPVEID